MEKFERFKLETLETPESERGRMVRTLNAHSEAIEALAARLGDAEHLLRAHTDNHATAQVFATETHAPCDPHWMTEVNNALRRIDHQLCTHLAGHTTLWTDRDGRLMTADDAAAIVVVEFMRATTGDVHTDAWLERIRGRIISALRNHGRGD